MKSGLYGWLNKNLKGRKGQQGFTLIELLVVVTILGILAAIVTLSLVGLTTTANLNSCQQEYKTVQTAFDAFMADNNDSSITAQATATNDMTAVIDTGGHALWVDVGAVGVTQTHNYTRNGHTQFKYTWNSSGRVTGIVGGPSGCVVST